VDTNNHGMSGGGSIRNARVLLQRGLRINPTSDDLWLQSFLLEMHYVQKLRGRKHILLSPCVGGIQDSPSISKTEDQDILYGHVLPLIVYKNAIKAIPKDVSFRLRFLDICKQFPDTDSLNKEILSSLESDCGDFVDTWITRAMHLMTSHAISITRKGAVLDEDDEEDTNEESRKRKFTENQYASSIDGDVVVSKLIQLLQDATDRINSDEMYLRAIRLLVEIVGRREIESDELISFIDTLFIKARDQCIVSSALLLQYTDWLWTGDQLTKSYELFSTYLMVEKSLSDAQLWIKWAQISAKLMDSPQPISKTIYSPEFILQCAVDIIPMHDKGHFEVLSNLFLRQIHGMVSKDNNDRRNSHSLLNLFDKLLLLSAQNPCSTKEDERSLQMLCICSTFLRHALSLNDTDLIRSIYPRMFYSSSFLKQLKVKEQDSIETVSFLFDATITFERQLVMKNKNCSDRSRRIIDTAVDFFKDQGLETLAKVYKNKFI
jgi:U3 small nucleolar RNA-associated protein 6